jgi:hypothetical protein
MTEPGHDGMVTRLPKPKWCCPQAAALMRAHKDPCLQFHRRESGWLCERLHELCGRRRWPALDPHRQMIAGTSTIRSPLSISSRETTRVFCEIPQRQPTADDGSANLLECELAMLARNMQSLASRSIGWLCTRQRRTTTSQGVCGTHPTYSANATVRFASAAAGQFVTPRLLRAHRDILTGKHSTHLNAARSRPWSSPTGPGSSGFG